MPVLVSRRNAMPILVSPSLFLLLVSPDTAARFDGARPRRTTIATSERKRSALHHGGVYPRRMMIGWSRAESEHRSTWASHAVAAAARKIVTNTAPPLGSGSYGLSAPAVVATVARRWLMVHSPGAAQRTCLFRSTSAQFVLNLTHEGLDGIFGPSRS